MIYSILILFSLGIREFVFSNESLIESVDDYEMRETTNYEILLVH